MCKNGDELTSWHAANNMSMFVERTLPFVAPVDAYRDGATSEGVRNVLGNVGEWVAPSELDAEGRAGVRGGDFTDDLAVLRATRHRSLSRDTRRNTIGFRCVYEPPSAR